MKHAMIAPNERVGWQTIRRMEKDYHFFEVIDTHDNWAKVRLPNDRVDTFYVVTCEDQIRGKGINGLIMRALNSFSTDELYHFARRISLFRNAGTNNYLLERWGQAVGDAFEGEQVPYWHEVANICWKSINGEENPIIRGNWSSKHRSSHP